MPKWTDDQQRAIYEPSGEGNILVSAAAGSGKTAVLVERIANMIIEKSVSVDELLIVTFTEAAASEMRERIVNRINEAYRQAIDNKDAEKSRYLKEQMQLTSSADINTIDAFCLNVVKNNFHILGIDPNFGIMDKQEGDMLTDDTLSELFMSLYATEDEAEKERFTRLVNVYASNRDDEGLKRVVRKVYNFVQAFSEPEKWLVEKADMYSSDMANSKWLCDVVIGEKKESIVKSNKREWKYIFDRMLSRAEKYFNVKYDGSFPAESFEAAQEYWGKRLWKSICMCISASKALEDAKTWEDLQSFYEVYIAKKSYLGNSMKEMPKDAQAPRETWWMYYRKYDDLRDEFRAECKKLPVCGKAEFNESVHAGELKKTVDDIVWLTQKFSEMFEETKTKKNVKSFSDIEHLAYRLFADNKNISAEYAERYTEILIDEFQDTNGLQEAIFSSISRDNMNMFMVGDLKQSIYRFRGGDPTIFKNKSRNYAHSRTSGKRISLSQNFRSRMEVLRSVNALFGAVMSDDVGDVEYKGDETLQRDEERECYINGENLNHPMNKSIGYNSELYRLAVIDEDVSEDENVSADYAEAMFIADKIKELVDGHFQVYDGDGKYRDIRYNDIAVLVRSVRSGGEILSEMLESRGIPSFVQKEEYFERREIKLMLSLISLINNHMQDIPLAAVMRSPVGGFNESELARIRIGNRNGSFYNSVAGFTAEDEKDRILEIKCKRFISDLNRWRGYVKTKSIASLIWTLYEETGIYDFMGAIDGGEEAQANLKLLYERAKKYETSGFKGIFNFIRYIERIENRNDDISGAKLISENHNVVRIMTIHKSKGLEFPVVFLARTTKKFVINRPADENRIMLHKDLGIGVDYYNYENTYRKKLLFNEYISDANKKEYLSEEMRLLYVALTRAKEKLIITASKAYKDREEYEKTLDEWHDEYFSQKLSVRVSEKARSYADWIIPAIESDSTCWNKSDVEITTLAYNDTLLESREELVINDEDELSKSVQKILEYRYEYTESGLIPAKTSVTAIKEMEDVEHPREDDPVFMMQKPKFLRGEKLGAQIGTAHHQVMAYIDIDRLKGVKKEDYREFVMSEIMRIYDEGQIEKDIIDDEEIKDMICTNVCDFFEGDMGNELFFARKIYRERPFEIAIPATEYDPNLDKKYSDEKVVVQGIVDLYFEDRNGDIILVDYKTDRCKTKDEQTAIARKYKKQLELYAQAMEKILKKSVKEKYLYLFSAKSVVKLEQ